MIYNKISIIYVKTKYPSRVFPSHYMKKPTGDNLGESGFDFKTWESSPALMKDSENSCPSKRLQESY